MKILLLNANAGVTGIELSVVPPLGLLTVAAVLRQEGHEVSFVDADRRGLDMQALTAAVADVDPALIGLTMNTIMSGHVMDTATALKQAFPMVPIVVGGPHPSGFRGPVLDDCGAIDYLVIGEGEETAVELAAALEADDTAPAALARIAGLAFRDGPRAMVNAPRPGVKNVDAVPFPALDLAMPLDAYPGVYPPRLRPSLHVMTSRGCPFSCSFCSNPVWGRQVRYQSIPRVLLELRHAIERYGLREVYVMDDTLNCPKRRAKEIFRGIVREGLHRDTYFRVLFRANERLVDPELLDLAAAANVWLIFYGVESGSARINERINKRMKLEEIQRVLRMTHQAGIRSICSFMIGNLGEDRACVRESIEFARRIAPHYYDFPIATPLPGTAFHEEATRKGLIRVHDYHRYTFQTPVSETEHLRLDEIGELRDTAFAELDAHYRSDEHLRQRARELVEGGVDPHEAERTAALLVADAAAPGVAAGAVLPSEVNPAWLASTLVPGVDDALALGGGWYGPEEHEEDRYRWAGRIARLYLPAQTDARIEITVEPYLPSGAAPLDLLVEVDGRECGPFRFDEGGRRAIAIDLEDDGGNLGFRRVDLVASAAHRPVDVDPGSEDSRELAFLLLGARTTARRLETGPQAPAGDGIRLGAREHAVLTARIGVEKGNSATSWFGAFEQDGDGARRGRRDDAGRFADVLVTVGEDEDPTGATLGLTYRDSGEGTFQVAVLDERLEVATRVTVSRRASDRWRTLKLPWPAETRGAVVVLDARGEDLSVRDVRLIARGPIRLNLGCGPDIREGFVNLDLRGGRGVEVICDVSRLPFATGSSAELLADDILEHVPHARSRSLLGEWSRVIGEGGSLRVRTPSLEGILRLYRERPEGWRRPEGEEVDPIVIRLFGGQEYEGNFHHTIFDRPTLQAMLRECGLTVLDIGFDGEDISNLTAVAIKPSRARSEPADVDSSTRAVPTAPGESGRADDNSALGVGFEGLLLYS